MRTSRTTTPDPGSPADGSVTQPRGRRAHAGPPADEGPGLEQEPYVTGEPTPAHASLRPRTVRAKVISLLMVPVVSLLALWGFATVTTAQDVARGRDAQRVENTVLAPVASAVEALQGERTAAARQQAEPGDDHAAELEQRVTRTDAALDALRLGEDHSVADAGFLPAEAAARLTSFLDRTRDLRPLRTRLLAARGADKGASTGTDTAYTRYTEAIEAALGVPGALSGARESGTGSSARVLLELTRSGEMLAREESLLATATLTGTMDDEQLGAFAGAVASRRVLAVAAGADVPGAGRAAWRGLAASGAYRRLQAAEDAVLAAPPGRRAAAAVSAEDWERDARAVQKELRSVGRDSEAGAADDAGPFTHALFSSSGAAVLLGFLAVAASLLISVRIGRALVVELVGLRDSALDIARHKLPHAMRRLRAGEEIDVRAEAPLGRKSHDEIGQVGEALDTVHRAALDAAVERAELAGGISGVFVNLARRSQVLVHRQLALLDGMERRADDPGELGDLFRLDHLTTRMRRHAESLIILSGAAPGRAWRMPVPLTNVVRAAVSEIEDYARVEVRPLPDAAVKGVAVADLTHLLAELVENAAQFSPPHTKVRISGEPVGNGYALEIEDRGLGMGKELLDEANRRVAQSDTLDLFDSDRLGLFVVSRLSARHQIKVHLRTSAYGGTTAVVLLPTALLRVGPPEGSTPVSDTEEVTTAVVREDRGSAADPRATAFPAPVAVPALEPREASGQPRQQSGEPTRPRPAQPVTPIHRHARPVEDDGPLPRRIRQASLVPQLREQRRSEESVPNPGEPVTPDERTPEVARARMTAYRDGWVRGGGALPGDDTRPRTVSAATAPVSPHTEGDPA
ncbi:nitrate- and nitrite sensing domain-containing protein [Streptomyces sp. NPDC047973]|uniref:sensor histidine kinase n=1 Tax=Streptomyces sp. NPDC047973 TaxID=3155383 RepID=UPI0034397985